jgi:hypothetical protein
VTALLPHGDPGSCSQTGGALRRLASALEAASVRVGAPGSQAEESWPGRVARDIGKRHRLVVETAQTTAAQLDRTGMALQAHATDLAEALYEARAVEERATVAGLRLVDGQVRLPWGVSGVADAVSVSALEDHRDLLQADLDRAMVLLARRRQRLVETLTAARVELAEQALVLRS